MYRANSAEQKRNEESEKNCKKRYTTLYDRAFGKQPSGFVITVGQIDSEFADYYRYRDSLYTILEEEETNQMYLPNRPLLNNLYFELVEIHRDDSPEICKLRYIVSNELAQEIIAKNANIDAIELDNSICKLFSKLHCNINIGMSIINAFCHHFFLNLSLSES